MLTVEFNNMVIDRFSENAMNRPTRFYTIKNGCFYNSRIFSPLRKCFCLPIEFYPMVIAAVVVLFLACSPSAVFRRIAKGVINSVKRFSMWRLSHICKEIFKFIPALTNCYPSTTVIWICSMLRIIASLQHAIPYRKDFCVRHTMGGINASLRYCFSTTITTTGFRMPLNKISTKNNCLIAAITTAAESRCSIFGIFRSFQYYQFAESFTC